MYRRKKIIIRAASCEPQLSWLFGFAYMLIFEEEGRGRSAEVRLIIEVYVFEILLSGMLCSAVVIVWCVE